jgi:hypothetical protein
MNAAPAIYHNYMYVGSRTDASDGHRHPGVLVVNIADPTRPRVVGEIGRPTQKHQGETSRELRVWPQQKLLIVLDFECSAFIHDCADVDIPSFFRFYDLSNPARPRHISTYFPLEKPHEFFLWVDPQRPGERALMYYSVPTEDVTEPNMIVTDISRARRGQFKDVTSFNPNPLFSKQTIENRDVALHSMSVSYDGTRVHLAYLGGGYLVADSSEIAAGNVHGHISLLTKPEDRVRYTDPGAHSAVEVPGRPSYVVLTEEVYGDLLDITGANHGCPWGWVRIADVSNPAKPRVVSEYKVAENRQRYCESPAGQDPRNTERTSYSAHNPTVLPNLVLSSWHSAGLQAFSIRNPASPRTTGYFLPQPLRRVATEDPALSLGRNKVVMWSYPIIKDGLIYIVDIRNGLYVLRYTGAGSGVVHGVRFLEGNSNLGDARRFDRSAR